MLYVTSVWFYTIFVFHHGPWVEVFQTICWIRISLSRTELRGKWCHVNSWEYKRKKQNFACFDLIRCVLSLSYKTEILVRTQVWPEFFLHFSAFILFDALLGCIWTKKSHLNTHPPFYNLIPKFYLCDVSPHGHWGFLRNYLRKGLIVCQSTAAWTKLKLHHEDVW